MVGHLKKLNFPTVQGEFNGITNASHESKILPSTPMSMDVVVNTKPCEDSARAVTVWAALSSLLGKGVQCCVGAGDSCPLLSAAIIISLAFS